MSWQAGKIGTYVVLGVAAGSVGAWVPGPVWVAQALSVVLILWFAAALAGWAPEPALHIPGVSRLAMRSASGEGLGSRVVFGAANGLLPCGLVYAALGLAIASADPLAGGLAMLAFGLGTAPLVTTFAFSAQRLLAERPRARRALALALCVAGIWVVVRRGGATPHLN